MMCEVTCCQMIALLAKNNSSATEHEAALAASHLHATVRA